MLTIGKLAQAGGVGVETVRFYQRKGLLDTPPRGEGIRRYGEGDLRQLLFIRKAQQAGFALGEIKELLDLDESFDHGRARELTMRRITAIDRQIEQLEQARASLNRLARLCMRSRSGPCPILAAFDP